MKNKSKKFGLNEIILGTVLIIVIAGMGLGLWWCFKELSVIKQNQLQSQSMVEDLRNNTQEVVGNIAAIEQDQTKLQDVIEDVQENTKEIINKIAAIEKKQIKFQSTIDDMKNNIQKIVSNMAVIEKEQLKLQSLIDQRWIRSEVGKKEQVRPRKTEDKRILIDINNPEGERGWRDEYVIKLKPTGDIRREFGINWFRPHRVASISTERPDFINTLPIFRHDMQRYLILRLGDADDNQIVGVMDFRKPDRLHFPFDLYLDIDRDGDLAEDFIEDRRHIKGICVPYKDGTIENYALNLYSTHYEPIGVNYQSLAGRYGILEADKKRIQILIIDNSGNAIFNDDDDVILLDWDLDGKLDGSHQADDDRPLYSSLELPGGLYRVVELDAVGRRVVLRRDEAK